MEKYFDDILDNNEKVLKVFKPNRTKLYWSSVLIFLLSTIWVAIAPISFIIEQQSALDEIAFIAGIFTFAYAALFLFVWLLVKTYYKNIFYAYTDKRIIVRSGIWGVDFKSLDLKMIGAVNVYVSPLDKMLQKNTGTITFGSMASPIMTMGNGQHGSGYKLSNISSPYAVSKEIKIVIDEAKNN